MTRLSFCSGSSEKTTLEQCLHALMDGAPAFQATLSFFVSLVFFGVIGKYPPRVAKVSRSGCSVSCQNNTWLCGGRARKREKNKGLRPRVTRLKKKKKTISPTCEAKRMVHNPECDASHGELTRRTGTHPQLERTLGVFLLILFLALSAHIVLLAPARRLRWQ